MTGLELNQELNKALIQIKKQMEELRQEAVRLDFPPVKMRDERGVYIWADLVVAKAQVLHAIALLHDKDLQQ